MEDLEENKFYYVKMVNGKVKTLTHLLDEYNRPVLKGADGTWYYYWCDTERSDSVDYVIMEVPSYQEVTKLKEDIKTLKNIILKLSPSHRKYLEKNFKD